MEAAGVLGCKSDMELVVISHSTFRAESGVESRVVQICYYSIPQLQVIFSICLCLGFVPHATRQVNNARTKELKPPRGNLGLVFLVSIQRILS